jgi:hypothetical protein
MSTSESGLPPGQPWPDHPVVHEVNTAVWLGEVSRRAGRPLSLADAPAHEWDAVVPDGITVVWLMGVWTRSAAGRDIAMADSALRQSWSSALPGWTDDDVAGSPYCICEYEPDPSIGGWAGLDAARQQLRARGAGLMVDWVPNHVGPDSPWLLEVPEAFVHGTAEEAAAEPGAYLQIAGPTFAKGRDPYFPPWQDVVQVDAFSAALRDRAAAALTEIAGHADAVRCDMAMLMLDDVVKATWGDRVGPAPQRTYWAEVIAAVHAVHPQFRFVAEAYWDREWDLQQLGFDHCYDKRLYDRMSAGGAGQVRGHLGADLTYQQRLVRFLENHDEPRAAATFVPDARERACAIVIATLPGMTLWHEGQADGRKVFLPVFLRRRPNEPADSDLSAFHHRLWAVAPLVRRGTWRRSEVTGWPDNPSAEALLAWTWRDGDDGMALVVVNLSDGPADGVVHVDHAPAAGRRWRLTDLLDGTTYERDGDDLARNGLYVARPGWGAHVLSAAPA